MPFINRVGGGKPKKQTKTATIRYGYDSTEVKPDEGYLLEKVTFSYKVGSVTVTCSRSPYRTMTCNNVNLLQDNIKELVFVCKKASPGGTSYGGTNDGIIFAMHIVMNIKYGSSYRCYIIGQNSNAYGFCTETTLDSVGVLSFSENGCPTITLNDRYRVMNADYLFTYIATA